jgi:hypothetical protein
LDEEAREEGFLVGEVMGEVFEGGVLEVDLVEVREVLVNDGEAGDTFHTYLSLGF